ncbi:hypothetical protein OKW24_001092 [Peribacillus simplex]|nr:hypothetical protein [Peribacillus simplex]
MDGYPALAQMVEPKEPHQGHPSSRQNQCPVPI